MLATHDDKETGYLINVDLEYLDAIKIKTWCFLLCPEFKTVEEVFFNDFKKSGMPKKFRPVKNWMQLHRQKDYFEETWNLEVFVESGMKI